MVGSKVGHNNNGEEGSLALSLYRGGGGGGLNPTYIHEGGGEMRKDVVLGQSLTLPPLRGCTEGWRSQDGCRARGRLLVLVA